MNRRKITLLSCLLFSMATLFSCTPAQNNQSLKAGEEAKKSQSPKVGQVAKNESTSNTQMVLKNWNEADYRLPNVKNPHESLSQQFPGVFFYKGNLHLKQVALTFDDGPDNYYTPRILDILHSKGVHGTFFIVGKQAKRFPDMVKRIVADGNAVGNHSWDHPELWKITNERVTQEIVATQNQIQQITGIRTNLLRPPYGRVNPDEVKLIHILGYRIIDWSVDTLDWKGSSATSILQTVKKEISPGGIILEHCFAGHPGELNGTLQALPQIIDYLRAQGYEFVTVPTLLSH